MRQNIYSSYFAFRQLRLVEGKIDTSFRHFQNLMRKCLLGIRGKSTAGVILPLGPTAWIGQVTRTIDWISLRSLLQDLKP